MSKTKAMKVDVALTSPRGVDLVGHQRLELQSGVTRCLRARVHLDAAPQFQIKSARVGGSESIATQPRRSRQPLPECAVLDHGSLAFRLLNLQGPVARAAKHAADLGGCIDQLRSALDEVDRIQSSSSGAAQFLDWPEASADLSFIAPEKIAAVPVLELAGVRAGKVFEYSIPEDEKVTFLMVTVAPADAVEGEPSLVGVRLRDPVDQSGAGLPVTGLRGDARRIRLEHALQPAE